MLGASEALRSLPGRAFAASADCLRRTAIPVDFAAGSARRDAQTETRTSDPRAIEEVFHAPPIARNAQEPLT